MSEPSETVNLTLSRAQAERLHRILMFDEARGVYAGNVMSKLRRALDENRGSRVYDWHALRSDVVRRMASVDRESQHGASERPGEKQ